MNSHFTEDSYVTPAESKVSLLNRLLFGSRWAMYAEYFVEVLRARSRAVRGVYDDAEWAESSFRVLRTIERNRGRFHVSGIDRLRNAASSAPFVFISNHMSTLETQVLPTLIAPFMRVTFVVKEKLVTSPIFGPVMRSREPIAVRRRSAREDLETVLTKGRELLEKGMSIIVFPQSTRTPEFKPEEFNTLGIKLAINSGVPVFPIAVKTDFWGEKGLFRGFGPIRPSRTIHFEFGSPTKIAGRGKEEHKRIIDFILARQQEWAAADTRL